jgi:alkylation response protein AidB-like acyl-CoA dehydrogenase
VLWGLFGGLSIGAHPRQLLAPSSPDSLAAPCRAAGLPPVMNFGSKYLQDKCVKDCLQGKKFICLAITEPYAGSDVASLRTTAVKDPSGKFYVVNGEKKWITNGVFCDFFTVAVRTGGEGAGGLSLLLLERGMPGLATKQMKVRAAAAGCCHAL